MICELDNSCAEKLLPLLADLGYPNQDLENLHSRLGEFLSNKKSWIFGLFLKQELIGFGALSLIPLIHEDGYLGRISALAIKIEFQGQGLGKELITFIETRCSSYNCKRIEITSGANRSNDAHVFYQKVGYEKYSGSRFLKHI